MADNIENLLPRLRAEQVFGLDENVEGEWLDRGPPEHQLEVGMEIVWKNIRRLQRLRYCF